MRFVLQVDYEELNLTAPRDTTYEYDGLMSSTSAPSSASSEMIEYLIKKGSRVDASIKWGDHDVNLESHITSHKRPHSEESDANRKKLRRVATCGHFSHFSIATDSSPSGDKGQSSLLAQKENPFDVLFTPEWTFWLDENESSLAPGVCSPVSGRLTKSGSYRRSESCLTAESGHFGTQNSDKALTSSCPNLSGCRTYLGTLSRSGSMKRSDSFSRAGSIRPSTYTASEVTLLFIDIKGFTAECASMPAGLVGEWVSAFYERVDIIAAAHGVSRTEFRGDCCVCVAGAEGCVPAPAISVSPEVDRRSNQATRMLAFAAALHADLATLPGGAAFVAPTTARMGMATGAASFLVSDASMDPDAAAFSSVHGAAEAAAREMETLSAPGAVYVHRSTALKWAAEQRRPPPPIFDCGDKAAHRAAVYDLVAAGFCAVPTAGMAAEAAAAKAAAGRRSAARRLRRSSSAAF